MDTTLADYFARRRAIVLVYERVTKLTQEEIKTINTSISQIFADHELTIEEVKEILVGFDKVIKDMTNELSFTNTLNNYIEIKGYNVS